MLSVRVPMAPPLCAVCGALGMTIGAGQVGHASARSVVSPVAPQPEATPWVSERVRVNGVQVDLREATVPAEHSILSARLSTFWGVGEPGGAVRTTDRRRDGATVIGRQRGERHEVIRLQSVTQGLTRVVVSSLDLSRAAARVPDLPFPAVRGVTVLSVIETDGPHGATTFILEGPHGASSAEAVWADRLRLAGWATVRAYDGHRGVLGSAVGQVRWARRGAERLEAVVLRHGRGTRWVVRVSRDAH
jgi:hypothetical protein